jgi:hypothetical protein
MAGGMYLRDLWRQVLGPALAGQAVQMDATAERATGYNADDYQCTALTAAPKGLPASELDARQRDLLRALLAWAGPTEPGRPSTTGCRARSWSSSTTTPSATPTTRAALGGDHSRYSRQLPHSPSLLKPER